MAEVYGSTPESLAGETAVFVRKILTAVKSGKAIKNELFPHLQIINVRPKAKTEYPEVVEACKDVVCQVLERGGFVKPADHGRSAAKDYQPNDFGMSMVLGYSSIADLGLTFYGEVGMVREAMDISDKELCAISLAALQKIFTSNPELQKIRQNRTDMLCFRGDGKVDAPRPILKVNKQKLH